MQILRRPVGGATAPPAAGAPPGLVTLHVWRVPRRRVAAALSRVARDRFAVRRAAGARFVKVLGTGNGRTFSLLDARPDRWALLVAWDRAADATAFERSRVARAWAALADERSRLDLAPLTARGTWSRQTPFGPAVPRPASDEPVAVLTWARLRMRTAPDFWRAASPVATDLSGRAGLLFALGIGERPVGVQGTFSVWESAAAVRRFAYEGGPHVAAMGAAAEHGWFAEELFARFAVLGATGTVDGHDPLEGAEWGERAAATR